ncbi:MAG: LytTR family DNA-binding domain-containing protein [Bifidobacteriaceae bacterium]|nr:LytTR family DNA-binding domain-containing protein [Bifidobacteriaceae bacterium]
MESLHCRVAITDDEAPMREHLITLLNQYADEHNISIDIAEFDSGEALLHKYSPQYDLIMLDVEMGAQDGFTTAKAIRNIDSQVMILFVTNMSQYAIRGYEVNALSYLVKPVPYNALAHEMDKCIQRKQQIESTDALTFTINGVVTKVLLNNILYIESIKHKIIVHAFNARYEFNGTLKNLVPLLEPKNFFVSNSCYIVNLKYVNSIDALSCTMTDGTNLAVSRRRRKDFKQALTVYLGNQIF